MFITLTIREWEYKNVQEPMRNYCIPKYNPNTLWGLLFNKENNEMITIRKPVKWHKKSIQINKFNIKQLQSIQDGTLIIFSNGSEEVVIETIDEIKILSN